MRSILTFLLCWGYGMVNSQSLSVNTDGSVADPSSLLEIKSISKGMLIPRMTAAQRTAIPSPATSLLVYQTDGTAGYYYNAGTPASPAWTKLSTTTDLYWAPSGNHIRNTNTGFVGIGITVPLARLHVADSSVLFAAIGDKPLIPELPPIQGSGRRMMWYPGKAAFRAGYVPGTEWDYANIGDYSAAFGFRTTAYGLHSFSTGYWNGASGDNSFAAGNSNIAGGVSSAVFGNYNGATGDASFSTGENNAATADYSIAMGISNSAGGYANFAIGSYNQVADGSSGALGNSNNVSGVVSYALGDFNNVTNQSIAVGHNNVVYASFSGAYAFGSGNNAEDGATAIGGGNIVEGQSIALGYINTSTNSATAVIGSSCQALYLQSLSMGNQAWADSEKAFSIGNSTKAQGGNSFAIGNQAETSAPNAFAIGNLSYATQQSALSIGTNTSADGGYSTALGYENTAVGFYSTALGTYNITNGDYSASLGSSNTAYGYYSTVTGFNNVATSYASLVSGTYNDINDIPDYTLPVMTDRLFQLGNGTSTGNRSNALTILRNGFSGFGTNNVSPAAPVHIKYSSIPAIPQLLIEETSSSPSRVRFINTGIANNWDMSVVNKAGGNNNAAEFAFTYSDLGLDVLRLHGNGNATLAGTLTQLSDERAKKEIRPLQNSLQKLTRINGYNYHWKDEKADHNLQTGVLAQELQNTFPELVKEDAQGKLSVNYSGLIPILIESIKEQQQQILRLERVVEAFIKNK